MRTRRTKTSNFFLILFLCSVWGAILNNGIVKAQGTIQIKDDGGIQGTDFIQRTNCTYTFTNDISGNIIVFKDFITIDGAGFTLNGRGYSPQTGIDLTFRKNVTIKNLVITNQDIGIFCRPGAGTTANITIWNNFIHNCSTGIEFLGTSNNLIKFNTFRNNSIDISIEYVLGDNLITQNSIDSYVQVWMSDQPTIDMNYWTAYNGTDNDGDGIGDTAYYYHDTLMDNHPLIDPVPIIPENKLNLFGFLTLGIILLTIRLIYIRKEKMENSRLAYPLFIIVLILSNLMIVGIAFAQSISKPSSPDFTAKVVSNTIEVTIKNQPLTAYENGSFQSLYYMFRFKDHDAMIGFWDYDPPYFVLPSTYGGYYKASDSEFTVVSLSLEDQHFPSGQIDIQALALIGNQYPTNMQNGTVYGFEGEISGWSNYQTLTIGENPSLWLVIALVVVVVIIVGLLGYFKKRKR